MRRLWLNVAWIGIVNRTQERARQLVAEYAPVFPSTRIDTFADVSAISTATQGVDLIINSTSTGLRGESFPGDVLVPLAAEGVVYDMVYGPGETPRVRLARESGHRAADGLGMLAGQGEEAFLLWHGRHPEKGLMRRCLESDFAEK